MTAGWGKCPYRHEHTTPPLCSGFTRSARPVRTQGVLGTSGQLHLTPAKRGSAPGSWRPATAQQHLIHHTLQPRALTRQLLLISAQISLSWNWAPFKRCIMLKGACDAKTMPFFQRGRGDSLGDDPFPVRGCGFSLVYVNFSLRG